VEIKGANESRRGGPEPDTFRIDSSYYQFPLPVAFHGGK
jgi:hypothetical protein